MLRRLAIQNRSPQELRQLASERRDLATNSVSGIKSLLLREARLLDFHAELRAWLGLEAPRHQRPSAGQIKLDGKIRPPTPTDFAPFLAKLSSRMTLPASDQEAL